MKHQFLEPRAAQASQFPSEPLIQSVWANDLPSAIQELASCLEHGFTCVAFDTEFAGIDESLEFTMNYFERVIINVRRHKLLQIGLTLFNPHTHKIYGKCWQINFKFNPKEDLLEPKARQLLRENGMDFDQHF